MVVNRHAEPKVLWVNEYANGQDRLLWSAPGVILAEESMGRDYPDDEVLSDQVATIWCMAGPFIGFGAGYLAGVGSALLRQWGWL